MLKVVLCFAFIAVASSWSSNTSGRPDKEESIAPQIETADCQCKNGFCLPDKNGNMTCTCPSEYGLLTADYCEACECGDGANCSFDDELYLDGKLCICPPGYKESYGKCESLCASKPCLNNGNCFISEDDYKCVCSKKYVGRNCEQECDCGQKAYNCEIDIRGFKRCYCQLGYRESNETCIECDCGLHYKSCDTDPEGEQVCRCETGYSLHNGICKEECWSDRDCYNDGWCQRDDEGRFCSCEANYSGDKCEVDDICGSAEWRRKCSAMGAKCIRFGSNARCECSPPKIYDWIAEECSDPCNKDNCIHGYCVTYGNESMCYCHDGFTGHRCDIFLETRTSYGALVIILIILVALIIILTIPTIIIAVKNKALKKKLAE